MNNRQWLIVVGVVVVIGGVVWAGWELRPVSLINDESVTEISAEDLIPWSGEEEDSLAKAPSLEYWLELYAWHRSTEVGGAWLTIYLFCPKKEDDYYEYIGRRVTGGLVETFGLSLGPPVETKKEIYMVKKNGEAVYIFSEQYGEALRRLERIIHLPDG